MLYFTGAGTVRENLDPAGQHSERELIAALKAVNLWEVLAGVSLSQAKAADVPQRGPAATATPAAATPIASPAAGSTMARSVANSAPISIQGVLLLSVDAAMSASGFVSSTVVLFKS